MPMIYRIIAAAITAAAILAGADPARAAGPCQVSYDATVPVPSGWAAAYDVFHVAHTPLATVDCTVPATPLSVGEPNDTTVYVAQTAYLQASDAMGVWSPITLSGSQPAVNGWISIPAAAPLNLSSAQLNNNWNYIAFLTARWNGSKWLIGCADPVCTSHHFSLQAITKQTVLTVKVTPVAPNVSDDTALSATVATVACAWSDGSPCTAVFSLTDPASRYKLSGSNIIVDPAGGGVGAVGSTDTVQVTATQ